MATLERVLRGRRGLAAVGLLALLAALTPIDASAQSVALDLGEEADLTSRLVQLFALMTVLGLAPGLLIAGTCFPFMVVVLSILRQALGVQSTPPNMTLISLALFLTLFVMQPVMSEAWRDGVSPFIDGQITEAQAFERTLAPFRDYMAARVDAGNLAAIVELRGEDSDVAPESLLHSMAALVPAYMLTEIERGFTFGFLVFLPFLVIDLVVASVLMSMGMIMLPPVMIALPFKLAFFTVSDGWSLVTTAMVRSYGG